MPNVNWIDLLVAIVFVWGSISGFMRGLTYHFPRLLAIIGATVIALHYYERINNLIINNSSIPPLGSKLITIFLLSFIAYIIGKFVLTILSKLANIQLVYFLERIIGALAGTIRYILFLSLVSFMITMIEIPAIHNFYFEQGVTGKPLVGLCQQVHDVSINICTAFYKSFQSISSTEEPSKE